MRMKPKTARNIALAGALFLSSGCNDGGESVTEAKASEAIHVSEINRLTIERDLAAKVLNDGQVQFGLDLAALPDDCEKAVINYLPPEGDFLDVPSDQASQATAQWCGPDNLDAIPNLREEFTDLEKDRGEYEALQLAIAQHLGALGVQPAPTTTQS